MLGHLWSNNEARQRLGRRAHLRLGITMKPPVYSTRVTSIAITDRLNVSKDVCKWSYVKRSIGFAYTGKIYDPDIARSPS
jgi:hypothetical protein